VHQATIVANCRDADGKVVMRATVATTILQLVKSCGPRVYVAFEEGTQAESLAVGLNDIFWPRSGDI
jgi:hypothetical protein